MKYMHFTEEQLAYANHINLVAYARRQGYPVREYHPGYWKITGYGGLLIEPDKWYWEAEKKGGGPIQFVMMMKQLSWVEAVKELLKESDPDCQYHPGSDPVQAHRRTKEKSMFRLPAKNTTYEHIFAYLIKSRKLDQGLIQQLVKDKKLYEDVNQNCVFVGYDPEGAARFASMRGTKTQRPYKGDAAGSDKRYAFSCTGSTDTVYIFEAPIDLISYQSMLKQSGRELADHYITLAGISIAALERYLIDYPDIRKLVVCTDHDEAGEEAFRQIYKTYDRTCEVRRQSPKPYKDFNEYLIRREFQRFLAEQGLQPKNAETGYPQGISFR